YHIHEKAVPADGNCTGAGAHLDPFQRGETPDCDSGLPETCQVGDLAGKHGKVAGPDFSANYIDPYVSTTPGSASFAGNRSIVLHYANKTRFACANFVLASSSSSNGTATNGTVSPGPLPYTATASGSATGSASGRTGASATTTASAVASTGGAAALAVGVGAVVLGVLGVVV
ncbi:Cell surface superoxide dismutase [Cu-Zn] 4, partial [Elasticomyces elasticus]